jgi:hypothetical protein
MKGYAKEITLCKNKCFVSKGRKFLQGRAFHMKSFILERPEPFFCNSVFIRAGNMQLLFLSVPL